MIDIREILVRIFSAIFLSMCTGSCMFVFWMALRKFFADKIRPKVYDLILKIILIAYYVPAGYLLVNIFFDNGYVFDFTGTIIKAFYAIQNQALSRKLVWELVKSLLLSIVQRKNLQTQYFIRSFHSWDSYHC